MVTIPQIESNTPNRVQLGSVSAASPSVTSNAGGAEAGFSKQLASVFDFAGKQYQQRQAVIQQAESITARSNENIAAAEFSQGVISEANSMPLNERQQFIDESLQEYHDEVIDKYDGKPVLQAQIHDSLQQRKFRLENAAFEAAEKQKASEYRGSLDNNLQLIHSEIVQAGSEAERVGLYHQMDDAIDSAKQLGYITPESAESMRRAGRGKTVSGIIGRHVTAGQFSKAAGYMKANADFLSPSQLVNMERQIKTGAEAVQRRALSARRSAQAHQAEMQGYATTDPGRYAVEAMGVKENDPIAINNITGGRAVMPNSSAKKFAMTLQSMPAEQGVKLVQEFQKVNENAFNRQVLSSIPKERRADIGRLLEIASQDEVDLEMFEMHQKAVGSNSAMAESAGFSMKEARSAIADSPVYRDMQGYYRGAVMADTSHDYGSAHLDSLARSVLVAGSEKGMAKSDAVSRVMQVPDRHYTDIDGKILAIPKGIDPTNLRKVTSDFVGSVKASDIDIGNGKSMPAAVWAQELKAGNIKFSPLADPKNNKLVLTRDDVPIYMKYSNGKSKPIVMEYRDLMAIGEAAKRKQVKENAPDYKKVGKDGID